MLSKLTRNSRNLFLLAGGLALVAFVLAFSLLSKSQHPQNTRAAVNSGPTPVPVSVAPALVARADVPPLTAITDPNLAVSQYFNIDPHYKGYLPSDYVQGPVGLQQLIAKNNGLPLKLSSKLPKGQPLTASELITGTAATTQTIDFAPLLQKGEVEQIVSVQPTEAANGVIQPGDHVDVALNLKFDVTAGHATDHAFYNGNGTAINSDTKPGTLVGNLWETQGLLQNLRVLYVSGTNVVMAMSHQDALLLEWAKADNASVTLMVRSNDDAAGKGQYFRTDPVLPDSLFNTKYVKNKFKLP